MSLLITLGDQSVIHQSSDYCLSYQGKMTETANGTKQLEVHAGIWTARIAFTGIATDGQGYNSQEWLEQEGISLAPRSDPAVFVENLARRGTEELKKAMNYDRRLTILVALAAVGECRLFMVSNFEEPKKNPLGAPLETLRAFEFDLSSPKLVVNGAVGALPRSEKKCLERMFRTSSEPMALRARMAAANRVAASNRTYTNVISSGCWVTSIFSDGHSNGENYGQVAGIPSRLAPGFDISGFLRKFLPPAPGKEITIVQAVSAMGPPKPLPAETGEPREITFSTPTTCLQGIGRAAGSEFPRLTMAGNHSKVKLRKNVWVKAVLNTVTLEIDPTRDDAGGPLALECQQLRNVPTVDGGQPGSWDYMFDLHIGGGTAVLTIRQLSTSLRSGLNVLGPSEELHLAAPYGGLILTATRDAPKVCADIEAIFLLGDFQSDSSSSGVDCAQLTNSRSGSEVKVMKTKKGLALDSLWVIVKPGLIQNVTHLVFGTTNKFQVRHVSLYTSEQSAARFLEKCATKGFIRVHLPDASSVLEFLKIAQNGNAVCVSFNAMPDQPFTNVAIQEVIDDVQEFISSSWTER